jgi:tetratricopeptide (TPR) repeat protein
MGNNEAALSDYTEAIKISSESGNVYSPPEAYLARGTFYSELKKYDMAISDYTEAIAKITYIFKHPETRRPNLFDGIFVEQTNRICFMKRGFAYIKLEKFGPALKDFNKAIKLQIDERGLGNGNDIMAALHFLRGSAYDHLRKTYKAKFDMETALRLNPDYEEAREWIQNNKNRLIEPWD